VEIAAANRPGRPDLAVAPTRLADAAVATGADQLVLEGRGASRRLRDRGFAVERVLTRPRLDRPDVLVPLDRPRPASYALSHWLAADTRWRRARNGAARRLVRAGALPEAGPVTAVASRTTPPPYVLRAVAAEYGLPATAEAFLTLGQADALSRNLFHVFPDSGDRPEWVVKFARVPGYEIPFARDEKGLGLAHEAGGAVARHAPRLLGRLTIDGLHASVETAAPGGRLRDALRGPSSDRGKMAMVDRVAAWIVEMGRSTAAAPEALAEERLRLAREVLPPWAAQGFPPGLVQDLPPLPAVLQHNDMGAWNMVVDGTAFTVVDWESARRHGLPLWDLVYFLTDALGALDGAVTEAEQDEHARRLFRGELPSSEALFGWLRRAVAELGLPPDAVGPVVTLGWLHHGLSHLARDASLEQAAQGHGRAVPAIERIAPLWLADPALGPTWERWRAG
jgi:hypothetical protein